MGAGGANKRRINSPGFARTIGAADGGGWGRGGAGGANKFARIRPYDWRGGWRRMGGPGRLKYTEFDGH
jgi:hypothetical protein